MHRPAISEILKKNESYYSLVVAVAKRARDIAVEAEINGILMTEKPVKIAVDEFAKGKYKLIEQADIGLNIE
ncbi:MAG: DNA-directed polymerase, omega subunit [Oscillospiraceae bacterium]|jgi:DNA-directed RNA polymerase subunit omega|nr:DNA-directed polymerase, omega subunit [Oscillospiraceae bacterium]